MLSKEDNERLTRVGPGTPMGELLRRYWQPMALSSELPEKDGAPIRVRLLGEDLIAFRGTDGKVGLVDAYCPHRRAPLFFGRNEECGIRCVYHGWKFDVDGRCTDLPSEPATSAMKDHIAIKAYPTYEKGDVVWAYMGPKERMPTPPDYEWMRAPATHRHISKTYQANNYLQSLEGGLDSAHATFLHNMDIRNRTPIRSRDGAPQSEIDFTDYGFTYVSRRNLGDDGEYVRVYRFIMPCQQIRSTIMSMTTRRNEVPLIEGHLWVPIDDESVFAWSWMLGCDDAAVVTPEFAEGRERWMGRGQEHLIPGTFRLKRNAMNDYLVDRALQKAKTATGIDGINTQDVAIQEGMGPIVDRSQEHLGSSDKAIIAMRRQMLGATFAVERGDTPPGVDPMLSRDLRAYDCLIPKGTDWREELGGRIVAHW